MLRRGLRSAVAAHVARSIGDAPYASELSNVRIAYRRGLAELLKRFGRLAFDDPRAEP